MSARAVSYYREMEEVVLSVKSGKIKFFKPTLLSTRRMMDVLSALDREGRVDIGFASIYGGGLHCWIDPGWLPKKAQSEDQPSTREHVTHIGEVPRGTEEEDGS